MRRTPPGQIQKLYKQLYDLYERYPKRWTDEKGYGDADYFKSRMRSLLRDIQAALEGKPIPGTAPPIHGRFEGSPQRMWQDRQRMYPPAPTPQFDEDFEPEDYTQGRPMSRQITMTPGRSRFIPKKSKSRSIRPSFLRKGKRR